MIAKRPKRILAIDREVHALLVQEVGQPIQGKRVPSQIVQEKLASQTLRADRITPLRFALQAICMIDVPHLKT